MPKGYHTPYGYRGMMPDCHYHLFASEEEYLEARAEALAEAESFCKDQSF